MLNNNCLESEVYMKRKIYESPLTLRTEVELESEFMEKASVFEPDNGHDKGVSIEGHGFGNEGNYFNGKAPEGSGFTDDQWNSWDN